jgi:hypothetical protein
VGLAGSEVTTARSELPLGWLLWVEGGHSGHRRTGVRFGSQVWTSVAAVREVLLCKMKPVLLRGLSPKAIPRLSHLLRMRPRASGTPRLPGAIATIRPSGPCRPR